MSNLSDRDVVEQMNDVEMLKRPHLWHHMVLPMKRPYPDGRPGIQTALAMEPAKDGSVTVQVNGNLFGALEETEMKKYLDAEAVIDDGWRVD